MSSGQGRSEPGTVWQHKTDLGTRLAYGTVPLADDFHSVLLASLLVGALPTNGEAALAQSIVLQVHLIVHIERRVLKEKIVLPNHKERRFHNATLSLISQHHT